MGNIITLDENNKKLTRLWLIQSVGALALSGFFAIFLVAARSPKLGEMLPYKDFFKTSLTIHVNLSVLIWLTSITCTIFATQTKLLKAGYAGLVLCGIGSVIIAGSIFDVSAEAYLNNYIPMLNSEVFKFGIGIYLLGFLIASLMGFKVQSPYKSFRYFAGTSFFITLASFLTLALTNASLNLPANKDVYGFADHYEKLFWGFGHVIQFLYVNAVIFAVFFMIERYSKKQEAVLITNLKSYVFVINLILAVSGIYIINNYDVTSFEYTDYFTKQMKIFGGIAATLAFFIFFPQLITNYKNLAENKPVRNAIVWSIILFLAGGIISMMIKGVNTIIPAHYHGSIIGISLGMMAFTYYLMPTLNYGAIKGKMANIQPALYGFGQLLHIMGFAVSGGYGAMRKMPGQELPIEAKVYMGLMGLGGMISIIGGLFFVIVIFKCLLGGPKRI